jgi:hypothetical protein
MERYEKESYRQRDKAAKVNGRRVFREIFQQFLVKIGVDNYAYADSQVGNSEDLKDLSVCHFIFSLNI